MVVVLGVWMWLFCEEKRRRVGERREGTFIENKFVVGTHAVRLVGVGEGQPLRLSSMVFVASHRPDGQGGCNFLILK